MNKLRLSLSIFILLALVPSVTAQDAIDFTAQANPTTLSTDQRLTLTLTSEGDYQQIGEPQLPLLKGFNIVGSSRSSQFSMVNGIVTSRTVFTYQLQPTGTGTFTIDPATIVINGSTYRTEPITVQVVEGTAPTVTPDATAPGQTPPAAAPSQLSGQDLYVEADVSNANPFVGQQIIYYFRFYQAINLFSQPQLNWPAFAGFWTEDLTPNNVYYQTAGGRRYRVTEVRRALFPTNAGTFTIDPTQLTVPGDMFTREMSFETMTTTVQVQPLPPDAPSGFDGLVGQLDISASVEPTRTQVNEPLTLIVKVSGTGNITTLADPTQDIDTELSDWRLYDSQITTHVSQDDDLIQGEKIFERLMVPTTAGDLTLPPLKLIYFDPETKSYRQDETKVPLIRVTPGEGAADSPPSNVNDKQDIIVQGTDIRHIKAAPPTLTAQYRSLWEQPLYWVLWIIPILGVIGIWSWERHRKLSSVNPPYLRKQRALRVAYRHLDEARHKAIEDSQPTESLYALVSQALTQYIADKFDLAVAGLTSSEIHQTLARHNVPKSLVERFLDDLEWADSGRFAPVAAGRNIEDLIDETRATITELEQFISLSPGGDDT